MSQGMAEILMAVIFLSPFIFVTWVIYDMVKVSITCKKAERGDISYEDFRLYAGAKGIYLPTINSATAQKEN